MRVSDMTKTPWRTNDVVRITWKEGEFARLSYNEYDTPASQGNSRTRLMNQWRPTGQTRTEEGVITGLSRNCLEVRTHRTDSWLSLYDFMIESIEPVGDMNAWR